MRLFPHPLYSLHIYSKDCQVNVLNKRGGGDSCWCCKLAEISATELKRGQIKSERSRSGQQNFNNFLLTEDAVLFVAGLLKSLTNLSTL